MVKTIVFTEAKVDSLIRLKFGTLVESKPKVAYVSDAVLAKIFKCTAEHIRHQYMGRFHKIAIKGKPLLEQMEHARS